MGIKEKASKAAAGTMTIAAATTGLTCCTNNGAVDPAPPPLECADVGAGETLEAQGNLVAPDTIQVTVRHNGMWPWTVDSVAAVSGGTIHDLLLPQDNNPSQREMNFRLVLDAESSSASFTVYGHTADLDTRCQIVRQFTVTASGETITVALAPIHNLPLPARHEATLRLTDHDGQVVTLEARTAYPGELSLSWAASAGALDALPDGRASWTLPSERGIYQAEVIMDFGEDGVAFDALSVEVL